MHCMERQMAYLHLLLFSVMTSQILRRAYYQVNSRSLSTRSRDAVLERLGLVSVSRKSGKRSRSRLGLGPQRFVSQALFQQQKFTNVTALFAVRTLFFHPVDSLNLRV